MEVTAIQPGQEYTADAPSNVRPTWMAGVGARLRHVGAGRLDRIGRCRVDGVAAARGGQRRATSSTPRGHTATGTASGSFGRLLKANPDKQLYVATKIPPKNRVWPSRRGFSIQDVFPADYIREYTEKSLENLGIEAIDLLQFHVWEDDWARRRGGSASSPTSSARGS